jgi:RecJ-like exonuclease
VLVAIGIEAVVVDHPPPDRVVVRIYLRHMVNIRTEAIP